MNYYNEYDAGAAQWLKELMADGMIPKGHVDTRSISDVSPNDLIGYTQCHFFAGIGGWAFALGLAGWSPDRPVWTGSCPCQPFSTAGKQRGTEDERHLWPVFHRLIADCRPPVVFGEQVASKLGCEWLAGVRSDLEGLAYAVGAADLCAAGVGAPHLRQRLYWVADAGHMLGRGRTQPSVASQPEVADSGLVGDAGQPGLKRTDDNPRVPQRVQYVPTKSGADGDASRLADGEGPQGRDQRGHRPRQQSPWATSVALPCGDGKTRRVEPTIFPLAHGIPGRVGILRGAGNAIVPQVAEAFIRAYDSLT